ncbi:hypothetical protein GCM10027445_28180 [Amycolatopsis endophytica]
MVAQAIGLGSLRLDRQRELRESHDQTVSDLRAALPSWEFRVPSGGRRLWIRLPGVGSRRFTFVVRRGVAGGHLAGCPRVQR